MCIRQALIQSLFHFIGKLPVCGVNLFTSSLTYIKEIVKCKFGILIDTDGNALCTGDQISANPSPLFSCCQNGNIPILCVHQKNIVKTVFVKL